MDLNTFAAGVAAFGALSAAVAAFVALKPAHEASRAAKDQTEIQRDLMRQAAQPYVWADIQPDVQQGTMLHLVLGNAGPTLARNVRVSIDPPIPEHPSYSGATRVAQNRVAEGILSLAPGRVIRWSLGRGFDLLEDENDETQYRLEVTAEGPYGPLEPVSFYIRPRDWREARDAPEGNLHLVRKEIQSLTDAVNTVGSKLVKHVDRNPEPDRFVESSLADAITQNRSAEPSAE
ncbi:hypothetical protein GcLGCM259_1339 [Glutamicibacter creatinolyticus]|uniref:Uncharacterized protein n=1 Tax=Glutamicibacter creatinolyticus TaxID=162496 RepID=A0A5B7WT66_9MICC|nr:hypothetical protein [Glutamicibacter creatinolyticus]QCY47072.1 hypothetical protein GcLGCM259_1339 [Glutamicibacter creatinolyticus]